MKINKRSVVELRRLQSWSQEDLAAAAGVSVRTVQRMENQGVCSLETIKAIASAFDVRVEEMREEKVVFRRSKPLEKIRLALKLAINSMLIPYPIFFVFALVIMLMSMEGLMPELEAMLYIGLAGGVASCYAFVNAMRNYYEQIGQYKGN